MDDGLVSVNGTVQRKAYRVAAGDHVEVGAAAPMAAPPPPSGVEVVFADDHLVVVSKPSGVVVHAARGVRDGTLVDALLAKGKTLAPRGGEGRPGIVHRLDRDVSGLLVVAKTDDAHERLVDAMKAARDRAPLPRSRHRLAAERHREDRCAGRTCIRSTGRGWPSSLTGKPAVTWFSVDREARGHIAPGREARDRTHPPDPDPPRVDRAPDRWGYAYGRASGDREAARPPASVPACIPPGASRHPITEEPLLVQLPTAS